MVSQLQFIGLQANLNIHFDPLYSNFVESFTWVNFFLPFVKSAKNIANTLSKFKGKTIPYLVNVPDTFLNNMITLATVGYLIGMLYILCIQWITYKYPNNEKAKSWKKTLDTVFVAAILQILLLCYAQLVISSTVELLMARWLFVVAVIVLVNCCYSKVLRIQVTFAIPFPIWVLFFLRRNKEKIKAKSQATSLAEEVPAFAERYKTLYHRFNDSYFN